MAVAGAALEAAATVGEPWPASEAIAAEELRERLAHLTEPLAARRARERLARRMADALDDGDRALAEWTRDQLAAMRPRPISEEEGA